MRVKKILAEIPAVKCLDKLMADADAVSFDELRNAVGHILDAEGISIDDVTSIALKPNHEGNSYEELIFTVKGLPAGFFLDLCLPPDRAEETRVGLQEVYERRWLKRYPRPVARALCRVHGISIILAHQGSKISKFITVVFGFLGFKKFTGWFSGS